MEKATHGKAEGKIHLCSCGDIGEVYFVLFSEDSERSTVRDPSEGDGEGGEDDEPTQAYDLDSPRFDGEGAPMDIEPTVAYGNSVAIFCNNFILMIFSTTADLQDLEGSDKNDDSVASSPLLVGGPD